MCIYIYIHICVYYMHTYTYTYIYIYIYITTTRESSSGETLRLLAADGQEGCLRVVVLSCDIHTHTPAPESSSNFLLCPFVVCICSANWLGHGHGYEWLNS